MSADGPRREHYRRVTLDGGGMREWVDFELLKEDIVDDANASGGARPISVRVEPDVLAMLDAFAERFRMTRSKLLLQLIESGLAEGFVALPDDEQDAMCARASAKSEEAGFKIDFAADLARKRETEKRRARRGESETE